MDRRGGTRAAARGSAFDRGVPRWRKQVCVLVGAAVAVNLWMTILSVHADSAAADSHEQAGGLAYRVAQDSQDNNLALHDALMSKQMTSNLRRMAVAS